MKHRSVLKQKNKKHKSGHGKKDQFKDPKVGLSSANLHNEKGQKDRRTQASESRRENKILAAKVAKIVGSRNGPPKIVGILPCSENADAEAFTSLFDFEPEVEDFNLQSGTIKGGQFQCRITPLPIERSIDVLIDIGKVSDIIVLLFLSEEPLDEWGANAISVLKSIGLPQIMAVVVSLNGEPISKSSLANYKTYIQKDLPDVERVLPLVTPDDMAQFVRFLSVITPKQISWKENRPYMLIQNFEVNEEKQTIDLYGYLREAKLNVHQVITIPYLGDFYIACANEIEPSDELRHPLIFAHQENEDLITADIHPPQNIESLEGIEQVQNEFEKLGLEDQFVDNENENMEEDFEDDEMEAERAEELRRRNQEDLEFPDEFDIDDPSIPLRERLRRYRGLNSFKNDPWNPYESLPPQYSKIFEFSNFARISEAAIAEQETGEINPGERLKVTLFNGENDITAWSRVPQGRALTMFGLFRNETRFTVLNASFTNRGEPVRSKEQLLIICGFRHLWIHPLFSEYDTRAPKHLYMKVVDTNKQAIASFIAPAMMQSCPVSYFKETEGIMNFIGTGSIKTVDPCRMIIKRIILTGNPYKSIGKTARVTMMFYNKEDIMYFKSVKLKSKKRKTKGNITKPIGLKGHFKASFNEIVQQDDTVCMYLYKRVFPKLDTEPVTF